MTGKLVICPTPLGNLGDITLRTVEHLRSADTICAEDTRVTGKLLAALNIPGKRLERVDENTLPSRIPGLLERMQSGEVIAYCTDAGMPGVSDPGLRLVQAARHAHPAIEVDVLPGPTAVATAYVASGTDAQTFYFGGFFPRKEGDRAAALNALRHLDAALIYYESPKRLLSTLECLAKELPYRTAAVCRELTKIHEEVARATLPQLHDEFMARDAIKGEIVIVVDPPSDAEKNLQQSTARSQAMQRAHILAKEGMRAKQIVRVLVEETGISRNDAYAVALDAANV